MQILKIRYLGDTEAVVSVAGRVVGPDCVFELPATVVEELNDATVVTTGNPPSEWSLPKTLYRVETHTKAKSKPSKGEGSEG